METLTRIENHCTCGGDPDCQECGGSDLSPRVLSLLFRGADCTKAYALSEARKRHLERGLDSIRTGLVSVAAQSAQFEIQRSLVDQIAQITALLKEG